MKHPSLLFAASLALLASASAFAQDMFLPNDRYGIILGSARVSPHASAGVFFDSNPDYVREGEEDARFGTAEDYDSWGYSVQPGVDLKWQANHWLLAADAWYTMERFEKEFLESRDSWGESASLSFEGQRDLYVTVAESYKYVRETDEDAARWKDRYELAAGIDVDKALGEKTIVGAGAKYRSLDYDSSLLNDWSKVSLDARLARAITEKMNATLTGRYETDESEHQDGSADTWTGLLGVSSRATDKISYSLGVGVHFYTGFDDSEKTKFAYHAQAKWAPTEKFDLSLAGNTSFYPAEDEFDSSIYEIGAGLVARYRPISRWLLSASLNYQREDYTQEVRTGSNVIMDESAILGRHRVDNYVTAVAGASFALSQYASVNGRFAYSFDDSTIAEYSTTAGAPRSA
jgi:hypothetical protein